MISSLQDAWPALAVPLSVYVLAAASPGPSNMAIMGLAMARGRLQAVVFALGVVSGSMCWCLMAAAGISALLTAYAHAMVMLKIVGGLYLLYLAYRAARSALHPHAALAMRASQQTTLPSLYLRGLGLHLTNPKSILAWIAIMSIGLASETPAALPLLIFVCAAVLALVIFLGYALLFSTRWMQQLYASWRRWIEATLATVFAVAGIRLLTARL